VSGCFVSVVSEDGEWKVVGGVSVRYICLFFPFVMWFLSSRRHVGDPSLKTRNLRELHTRVRLVLTGSSDKGGG